MTSVGYVGVDLVTEEVVLITRDRERARDCYLLRAEYAQDGSGVIVLDRDDTYNGRRATEIALASQGCGLGWTFRVAGEVDWDTAPISVENRNLSRAWSV